MFRLEYLYPIFLMAAIRGGGCTLLSRSLVTQQIGAFGPSLPADTVYVPYSGLGPSFSLAMDQYDSLFLSEDECKANASIRGAHMWSYDSNSGWCFLGSLTHPVCRSYQGSDSGFILEEYLSDGSPSDNAVLDPDLTGDLMKRDDPLSFRVEDPTILHIDGFTDPIGYPWSKAEQLDKFVLFPNDGSVVATDDNIIVDPECYSNSSCGVPFMTNSLLARFLPFYTMQDHCGQVLYADESFGLNIASHSGIGCEFFPNPYPTMPCWVIVNASKPLKFKVTLINFRDQDCDGFKLRFRVSQDNDTRDIYHLCNANAPTEFISTSGHARISLYGQPNVTDYKKYGFIINVMNVFN